jgi:hypothetical protein
MTVMLNRIAHPTMPTRDCLIDFELIVRQSTDSGSANALSLAQQDAVPEGAFRTPFRERNLK